MGTKKHALLSSSSAHIWGHCPPSARLAAAFPDSPSPAAAEGTAAHALAEHKLKKALKRRSRRPRSEFDDDTMEEYTDGYVAFVLEQAKAVPDAAIFIEQRLNLSRWVPEAFGTADCVIIGDGRLHVIDLKYGAGVVVAAERNPQLMLYALGAIDTFGCLYDVSDVRLSIYQPRRDNISTWEIQASNLLKWAENELAPRARLAFAGEGEFSAGPWCQFCRAAVKCRARAEMQLAVAREEFALPPLLSDEEIAKILPRLPPLVKWAQDVMAYASESAIEHGKAWPGFKVVAGRSVRKFSDEAAVIDAARTAGYTDIFEEKLITLTAMERLMGKKNFSEILGQLVIKPPGKPTLVPDTDKRAATDVSTPDKEFGGN